MGVFVFRGIDFLLYLAVKTYLNLKQVIRSNTH